MHVHNQQIVRIGKSTYISFDLSMCVFDRVHGFLCSGEILRVTQLIWRPALWVRIMYFCTWKGHGAMNYFKHLPNEYSFSIPRYYLLKVLEFSTQSQQSICNIELQYESNYTKSVWCDCVKVRRRFRGGS